MRFRILLTGLLLTASQAALADCAPSTKDVNQDGVVDVLDAICSLEGLLITLKEPDASLPPCANVPTIDTNCDGELNLVDVAIIHAAVLDQGLPIQVDSTNNGCPDACDTPATALGAAIPQWELEDVQPDSDTFGMLTGPKAGPGVRVVALLDGG